MKRLHLHLATGAAALAAVVAQACSDGAPIGAGGGTSSASSSSSDAASSSAQASTAASSSSSSGAASTTSSSSSSSSASGSSSSSGGAPVDCGPGSDLIYLVSSIRSVFTFDPVTLAFQKIGTVSCNIDPSYAPAAMAIDRKGIIHLRFIDHQIYDIDTKTMACSPTPYVPQQGDFFHYEMTYAADAKGSSAETLYLSAWTGWGLDTLDTTTWTPSPVGPYDMVKEYALLAGTPEGRLFAMFLSNQGVPPVPPIFAELDKANAQVLSQAPISGLPPLSKFSTTSATFSFWGGDFYIFHVNASEWGVDKYSPATSTLTPLPAVFPTNFPLVAATSTCVPVPP